MSTNELNGQYRARAVDCALGEASTGSEQVAVAFEIIEEGDGLGSRITWYGYFTEKALEQTVRGLRAAGWKGTDVGELASFETAGLTNEVVLVVEQEPDQQGVMRARVRWVNSIGSIAIKQRLDAVKTADLAKRLKGAILAIDNSAKLPKAKSPAAPASSRRPEPPPHTDDDMPF